MSHEDHTFTLTLSNSEEFNRVLSSINPAEYEDCLTFIANPHELTLAWEGPGSDDIAYRVVEQFPDIVFKICWFSIGDWPNWTFGLSENGVVKWLELSPELDETINDMLFLGVDVDPYLGPTPENYKQYEQLKKEWDDANPPC